MIAPGAVTSGLSLPSRVGPRLLKEDIFWAAGDPLGGGRGDFVLKDPTAITAFPLAGSVIVPESVATLNVPSTSSI
jgi:hypothetical protein